MKKTGLLVFLVFVVNVFCFSQTKTTDSLLKRLSYTKEDSIKVQLLNDLFLEVEFEDDVKAEEYLSKALALSEKRGYKRGLATTHMCFGFFAEDKGNYAEALRHYFKALKFSKELKDKKNMAGLYTCIGIVYDNQGNYPEALKKHFGALKLYEEIGDKKDIGDTYNNIGLIYDLQGNFSEALKNHYLSLKIEQANNDLSGIATTYINIGIIYEKKEDYTKALQMYDSSLVIFKKLDDKRNLAHLYNNMGVVYYDLKDYERSLKSHFMALGIREAIGDKNGIASSYCNIGHLYIKQKKHREAESYLFKAVELAKKTGSKLTMKFAYMYLTDLYHSKGNFKEAYKNHRMYILYKDSMDNEETRKRTIQNQMTFDFEKKEAIATMEHKKQVENQKLLAKEKSRKQRIIILFTVMGFLLVAMFAGFVFRSLRITRKQKRVIELQKDLVEKQKQEVELQKHLVEEHQKEIIDSITYAKRLQQAILPSIEEVKKYLPESFIYYKPKDIVAGDFYWLEYKEGITFIAAADSTGHGVPGAMVSVVCSNALNRAVNEFNLRDTGKILDKTRELVLETFAKSGEEIKDGMDVSLLAIHKEKNKAYWSGANNQLWYMQPDQDVMMQEIKPDKQPIGKTDNPKPFAKHSIDLTTGMLFYLMTDGYADQFGGEKGKKFKYKQLQELLSANCQMDPDKQKEELAQSFAQWKANLEQVDDVTIIGIRI